jgi:hypothetical protein
MIIAPLVFTTLVVGVVHMGDIKSVGRIGGKTLLWFVSAPPSPVSRKAASSCSSTTNGFSSACRPARPSTCQ